MVWFDANPSYKAVTRDLISWWDLVAVGGMVAGPSYSGSTQRAVDAFASSNRLHVHTAPATSKGGKMWYIVKN